MTDASRLEWGASALLAALAGTWEGVGHGEYQTIDSFDYREHAEFVFDESRRLVRYSFDDTIIGPNGEDLRPTHAEVGILKLTEDDDFELLSAQTGRIEVLRGRISAVPRSAAMELRLESVVIAHDPRVANSARILRLEDDALHYEVWMELANLNGSQIHTRATLRRED